MKFLEDKLEELDLYFEPKKETDKWAMIVGVAGIIGYLAYGFLLPYTEELYKKSEKQKERLEVSIKDNSTYLKSITIGGDRDHYIKKYDKEIVNKKKHIVNLKHKIKLVNTNLDKLSDMLFNKRSWSKFLNSITDKASLHNVELDYIENNFANNKGSFGHVLEISVGCKGDYRNIIQFINEIEQNVLVTDIFKTELALDKESSKIVATIHISVWGINH